MPPLETGSTSVILIAKDTVIMNRGRDLRDHLLTIHSFCVIIQEEEVSVILASCTGKDRDSKRRKKPDPKVRVAETEEESLCKD